MIYPLKYIENHPAYGLHEAVAWFVNHMKDHEDFEIDLFVDDFQEIVPILQSHDKFVEHLQKLHLAFHSIDSDEEKVRVTKSFNYWNKISHVCHICDDEFILWDELDEDIRNCYKNLYEYLYEQLTKESKELEDRGMLRRQHYRSFWKANGKVCCYCGIRELDDPDWKLNAYDHYLHISKYPFCGVNYLNIVPICDKCNESPAKGPKHVVFSNYKNRVRREAFFPYEGINQPSIQIEIDNIFTGDCNVNLDFHGDSEEKIQTWKDVFDIDARYKSAVKTEKQVWIKNLVKYSREILQSIDDLKTEIRNHIEELVDSSRYLYQHLEIAFWNSILENDTEIELLLDHVKDVRTAKHS